MHALIAAFQLETISLHACPYFFKFARLQGQGKKHKASHYFIGLGRF